MLTGRLLDADSGATRIATVWRTTTPWDRLRGLLGRPQLGTGQGLLLDPCGSVHTLFMRYPIDVVYLDRALEVIKIVDSLAPWRASLALRAAATLELAAGTAGGLGLQPGQRLHWQALTGA